MKAITTTASRLQLNDVLGILSLILWTLVIIPSHQTHRHPAEGRQPRRRRHPGADGAGLRHHLLQHDRFSCCWACWARRCFTATASSLPPCRSCRRLRALRSLTLAFLALRHSDHDRRYRLALFYFQSKGMSEGVVPVRADGRAVVVHRSSPSRALQHIHGSAYRPDRGQSLLRGGFSSSHTEKGFAFVALGSVFLCGHGRSRLCMPTSATLAAAPSRRPGCGSSCPALASTTPVRPRSLACRSFGWRTAHFSKWWR